jgi:hypothetical protein
MLSQTALFLTLNQLQISLFDLVTDLSLALFLQGKLLFSSLFLDLLLREGLLCLLDEVFGQ